jgi:hypothetical protein
MLLNSVLYTTSNGITCEVVRANAISDGCKDIRRNREEVPGYPKKNCR